MVISVHFTCQWFNVQHLSSFRETKFCNIKAQILTVTSTGFSSHQRKRKVCRNNFSLNKHFAETDFYFREFKSLSAQSLFKLLRVAH